ncbi:RiPP maturation radical SAM C-methyltransferase [Pseudoalteromonas maricaloris]|uniref:RiPP maturation radical SAM C-methyltransferase n=1 Tax=Pseudoalteromonas maricaloris TaxID=184924 RepID=UPI00029AB25D|nr:RiPP maturation radical SAM C-methyltransferase [Pseudoalteromonas flavipulchra]
MSKRLIPNVALICMPWQSVAFASVGLSVVKSELTSRGFKSEVLYSNFLLYNELGEELYNKISLSKHVGDLLFCPFLYGLTPQENPHWFQRAQEYCFEECEISASLFLHLSTKVVCKFLKNLESLILDNKFNFVGLGFTYTQTIANFALVKMLKLKSEKIVTIGGGRAVTEEFSTLAKLHYKFDFMVIGESGGRFGEIIEQALKNEVSLNSSKVLQKSEFIKPDYSEYYSVKNKYSLPFDDWYSIEFSKGCWWGERNMCSFCGLNGESAKYIEKAYDDVVNEIVWAHKNYKVSNFSLSDNILTKNESLFVRLMEVREKIPSLKFFAQVKSNLSENEIKLLSNAGVHIVQPGIESFNTGILKKMNKGNTATQQITTLKNLKKSNIESIYGILWGTVGETVEELKSQLEIIPLLHHISPPSYFSKITFDRYSPYFNNPLKYGLHDLKPSNVVELIYENSPHKPDALCWEYESNYIFKRNDYHEYMDLIEKTRKEILLWKKKHHKSQFFYFSDNAGRVTVVKNSEGAYSTIELSIEESHLVRKIEELSGLRSDNKGFIDNVKSKNLILSLINKGVIAELEGKYIVLPLFTHKKKLVLIVGESCVGKSTLCEYVKSLGYSVFTVSDFLIEKFGFDFYRLPPKEKISKIGKGESIFHALIEELKKFKSEDIIFVDSIKSKFDPDVIKQHFPDADISILRIKTKSNMRANRFYIRNRVGDEDSINLKDNNLHEIGIEELLSLDAYVIENNSSLESFKHQIDKYLDQCLMRMNNVEVHSSVPGRDLLKV